MRKVWLFVSQDAAAETIGIEAASPDAATRAIAERFPSFHRLTHYPHPGLDFGGEGDEIIVRKYKSLETT
ncbi:MAG: hypothetical protein M3O03_09495 [Pseudomonadota bacterium]|nr:hypothetical protein [Pseudomonadota bacterium]